jgi:hypothetical protein
MHHFRITPLRLAAAVVVGSFAFAGVGYAASLGLLSKQLFVWNQTLTKGTCNQTSTTAYDTYVQQASPNSTSGGTATTLRIVPTAGSQEYSFIRFDLSGCNLPTTGGADSAALSVYVTTAGNSTVSLYPVYSTWSESTLNWNGLGGLTIGSTATTTFSGSTTGAKTVTVTADVDAAIKAGTLWGWELKATTGTAAVVLASSENGTTSRRPSMTLSYEK